MPVKRKRSQVGSPRWLTALSIAVLVIPICLPLLTFQLPSGHDAFSYHPRLVEFHENITHGIFLPRWAPDLEFGAGQPVFLFTPPLPYYAAELWRLLGFDSVVSFNLAAVVTIVASACSMFLFADYQFGRNAAWLAAAAYVWAPYFHVDIFVRHAFGELAAFPLYPLVLYGFCRYNRERNRRFLLLGAVAWSGIIMTHNPSALLFSPLLLAFTIFLGWRGRSLRLTIAMIGGILIGIGLAAFVWLPILAEVKFVHIERALQGRLNYADHFVFLEQFLSQDWRYGSSIPGPGDQFSFSLGFGHLILIPAAVWFVYTSKKRSLRPWLTFLGCSAAILTLMMTPMARWFWDNLPLLKQVQFPWRILGDDILVIAILAGLYGASLEDRARAGIWFWIGIGLLILPNLTHVGPEQYFPVIAAEWTPRTLAEGGVETTADAEFEPQWVKQRVAYTEDKVLVLSGSATISGIQRTPTFWTFESNAQTDTMIEAALLYFPGWTVSVDGREIPIEIGNTGRIQFRLPAGMHHVLIEFKRTTVRLAAELVSLSTLFIVIVLFFRPRLGSK